MVGEPYRSGCRKVNHGENDSIKGLTNLRMYGSLLLNSRNAIAVNCGCEAADE